MAGFVPLCRSSDLSISILLVSGDEKYLRNVSEGLRQAGNAENENFLKVYTCESVVQVLRGTETPEVDFVVLCVSQKHFNAIAEIEQNILKLDQAFMLDRICLLCDNAQTSGSVVPKILHLKHKYQLHVLWGDLEAGAQIVSKRIVNLVSAVTGVVSGFPLITHRVWHQKHGQGSDFSSAIDEENMTF